MADHQPSSTTALTPPSSPSSSPSAPPRRGRRLPNVPHDDDAQAIIRATKTQRDRLMMLLMRYAGLRVSEVCKLQISHLDFRDRVLWVREGKGRRDRCIPIMKSLVGPLRGWIAGRAEGYVFPSSHGAAAGDCRKLTTRTVELVVKRLAVAAKLPGATDPRRYHPHCLRHCFATSLLRTGADIMEVKELMGHSHLATTTVYLHVDTSRLQSAVDRLAE